MTTPPTTPPPHIPPAIAEHISALIEYNWASEEADHHRDPDENDVFPRLQALREWLTNTPPPPAADIGDRFEHDGRSHAVTSWLKRNPTPTDNSVMAGPDACSLVFCLREEAEYVEFPAGILRVADVTATEDSDWPAEVVEHLRRRVAEAYGREVS